jgi:hypothetical protein
LVSTTTTWTVLPEILFGALIVEPDVVQVDESSSATNASF